MRRLRHSLGGYLRSLEISRYQVFAFVEGVEVDPFFYGEICRRVCEATSVGYQVRPARELPGDAGGKNALIAFYRFARSRAKLIAELGGKRTIMVFFLDKDVDDLRKKKCRSPHVIYTTYYDVQNHIVRHCDFDRSVSAAASIDRMELLAHLTFTGDWRHSAVQRWRKWIALCLLSIKYGIPGPNYRAPSQINDPMNGPVDPAKYEAAIQAAARHIGATTADIQRKMAALLKTVDRHLLDGTYDLVFKGKWYALLLEADLRSAFADRAYHFNGVAKRAPTVMATTVDFSRPWATRFLDSLADMVNQL